MKLVELKRKLKDSTRQHPVIVKHFKNNNYEVLAIAKHTETGEEFVIYRPVLSPEDIYARPADMFCSPVDKEKYPNVAQQDRFELLDTNDIQTSNSFKVSPSEVFEYIAQHLDTFILPHYITSQILALSQVAYSKIVCGTVVEIIRYKDGFDIQTKVSNNAYYNVRCYNETGAFMEHHKVFYNHHFASK